MPCHHYPTGGHYSCVVCIRERIIELKEQKQNIEREISDLLQQLGETT